MILIYPSITELYDKCEEFHRTLENVPTPGNIVLIINNILVTITLTMFMIDDISADNIWAAKSRNQGNWFYDMASFGTTVTGYCIILCAFIYVCVFYQVCKDNAGFDVGCGFMFNILGAVFSIPPTYPYLNEQIVGPDYQIIQCKQIDSLGSWQDRGYRISKLWVVYQYQYKKGLFLTWLKEQKEKSKQHIKPTNIQNVKSDIVEIVTIG
ncbi:hypothetical protein F8M41_019411 [Gigaspora margarita]|uniref:Uncharacterized protein n=1 Tax=Gigaspora margarita TaxID=4874 RepID=A0A8H4B2E4_GIGMA|nr:hypothetical protein F8M41_019411 [Gigaspora margarita]